MLTAEALYRQFASDAPKLIECVPQKDLAAFIGVTPVGLNRIIRRCAQSAHVQGAQAATRLESV